MTDENHQWHHIDDVEIPHYKCWCGREFMSSLRMRKHRESGECDSDTVTVGVNGHEVTGDAADVRELIHA